MVRLELARIGFAAGLLQKVEANILNWLVEVLSPENEEAYIPLCGLFWLEKLSF
jgi:hypothetical protein